MENITKKNIESLELKDLGPIAVFLLLFNLLAMGVLDYKPGALNLIYRYGNKVKNKVPLKCIEKDLEGRTRIDYLGETFYGQNLVVEGVDGNSYVVTANDLLKDPKAELVPYQNAVIHVLKQPGETNSNRGILVEEASAK